MRAGGLGLSYLAHIVGVTVRLRTGEKKGAFA